MERERKEVRCCWSHGLGYMHMLKEIRLVLEIPRARAHFNWLADHHNARCGNLRSVEDDLGGTMTEIAENDALDPCIAKRASEFGCRSVVRLATRVAGA